ncbi:MAG: hypothetical protein ACUVV4_03345 [Candidatus Bathyarchaeia archaeon]
MSFRRLVVFVTMLMIMTFPFIGAKTKTQMDLVYAPSLEYSHQVTTL